MCEQIHHENRVQLHKTEEPKKKQWSLRHWISLWGQRVVTALLESMIDISKNKQKPKTYLYLCDFW